MVVRQNFHNNVLSEAHARGFTSDVAFMTKD